MTSRGNGSGQDCISVAFYGIQAGQDCLVAFYRDVIEWFNNVGCTPDKLAVQAPGFSGKWVGFTRTHSRIIRHGLAEVASISICKLHEGGTVPLQHWLCNVSVDLDRKPSFVLESLSSICTLEDPRLNQLVMSCIRNLNPVYGIGFSADRDSGPGFYAIGLNYVPSSKPRVAETKESYEALLKVSRWGDLGMAKEVYREGYLRDVYPYNYLSDPQLKARVRKQTLQEWISADRTRGSLNALSDRMMLWKVDSTQLQSVREQLSSTDVFFDWKTYPD